MISAPNLSPRGGQGSEGKRAGIRWLMQHDLYALAQILMRDVTNSQLSKAFHGPLCTYMLTTPHLKNLYMLQRNAFKTTVITGIRNTQRILKRPDIRILIASNKLENAADMLKGIKANLMDPLLVWAFPDILWADPAKDAERWTEHAITVKRKAARGHTVEVIGEGGELASKHYHHITMDDVVGRENSQTRERLADVIQFVRLATSLVDDPRTSTVDYVGTPWHYADAYAWLREQKARHGMPLGEYLMPCWNPALPHEDGAIDADASAERLGLPPAGFGWVTPTFPERMDVDTLLHIRAEKGPSEFSAQYLLDPVSADTVVFPRAKVQRVPRNQVPAGLWTVMTVDPAISQETWADFSALAVVGFDRDNAMWITDLRQGRWMPSRLIDEVYLAWSRTPGIMAVGFEVVGFQKIFGALFAAEGERRGHHLPIIKLPRDTRQAKQARIRTLEPAWASGRIYIVDDVPALEDLLYDAERWRPDVENARDDLLDALADSWTLRQRPHLVADPGEHEAFLYDDPVMAERARWEAAILRTKPTLDQADLAMGWLMEQRRRAHEADRGIANSDVERADWLRVG